MKKIIFIIFLGIGLYSASAQLVSGNIKATDSYPQQRFGIGVSTALFDGDEEQNAFLHNWSISNTQIDDFGYYSCITPGSSTFFSLFFSYQYHYNYKWYLSALIKLNNRSVRYYHYELLSPNDYSRSLIMMDLLDLEVPMMINYSLPISDNAKWTAGLGAGLVLNLWKQDVDALGTETTVYSGNVYKFDYGYELKAIKAVSPILKASTGFTFDVGKRLMDFYVSYTYYLNKPYLFYASDIATACGTSPFKENTLQNFWAQWMKNRKHST